MSDYGIVFISAVVAAAVAGSIALILGRRKYRAEITKGKTDNHDGIIDDAPHIDGDNVKRGLDEENRAIAKALILEEKARQIPLQGQVSSEGKKRSKKDRRSKSGRNRH